MDDNDLLRAGKLPPIDDPAADAAPPTPPPRVTGTDLSDLGNARLMATRAARLRYAPSLGWLHYISGVWNLDAGDVFATRIAAEILDEKFLAAGANVVAASRLPDSEARKVAVSVAEVEEAWYRSSRRDKKRLAAMLSIGGTVEGVTVDPAALDRDPWLLNVANGTINLVTGALRPHDPADLITHQAPVAYDPKAVAPRWLKYLEEVFRGDAEIIEFVCRWVGYCLTGSVKEQKFALFNGVGANGKSLMFRVLAALFGSYATPIDVETTLVARDKGGGPRADIMDLRGARLAYASEFAEGNKLAVRFVKSLTGGEKLTARAPYAKSYVKFDTTVKMVVATNFLPEVSGSDPALWRRLRVVPFEQSFYGKADNRNLFETLSDELSGILAWAVVGCRAWQEGGLGESAAVAEAGQAYRSEQDVVGRFINERCERDAAAWVGRDLVFEEFTKWCDTENEPSGTAKRFAQQLKLHGIKDGGKRGIGGAGGVRVWSGLRVVGTGHRSHTSPTPDAPSERAS